MARQLRDRGRVNYAEVDVDGNAPKDGLLKFTQSGVNNAHRSVSPKQRDKGRTRRRYVWLLRCLITVT